MNSLFESLTPSQSSNTLNPMQVMQQMRNFTGTPEQARQQFCNRIADMGLTKSQLNSLLDNIEEQARSMGFM